MFWRGFSYGVILSATASGCVALLFALFPAGWAVAIIVGLLGFGFARIYLKGDRRRQRREARHRAERKREAAELAPLLAIAPNAFEDFERIRRDYRSAA